MASLPPAPARFKANLIGLTDVFNDILRDAANSGIDTTTMVLGVNIAKSLIQGSPDDVGLLDGFIRRSSPYWNQIALKDRKFLIQNSSVLFNEVPPEYVRSFFQLFEMKSPRGEPLISPLHEDEIWDYLRAMVKISIKYIHERRDMKSIEKSENGMIRVVREYTKEFFPNLSISELKDRWNLSLA